MNPPIVVELTTPSSHSASRATAINQSITPPPDVTGGPVAMHFASPARAAARVRDYFRCILSSFALIASLVSPNLSWMTP
jgi:hypothetical protein